MFAESGKVPSYSPRRQPPDTSLEESSAAVTRRDSVVLPTGLVTAHLARDVGFPVKRRQELQQARGDQFTEIINWVLILYYVTMSKAGLY